MNFYEFLIPTQLDGNQLKTHLGCDDVYIRGDRLVVVSDDTLEKVTAGLATYIYSPPSPLTPAQKLQDAGLTVADLKSLLNLP